MVAPATSKQRRVIKPQPGYQTLALSSPADIIIGGAMAGVGKSFTLLLDPLRDIHIPGFGGVIFRRTSPQIRNQGGLWDTSMELYPHAQGTPKETTLEWQFPKGTKMRFCHLEYEKNIFDWQGAQVPYIGFDELTHFTKRMFFYMLSRNRSTCGVKPYMRATCNPDPESWVYELIKWWIDDETGNPIPGRDGVIRYLMLDGDNYIWGDSYEDVLSKGAHLIRDIPDYINPHDLVKTVTFISGSIYDNKELIGKNPAYLGNLLAQDDETKARLLHGNWKPIISDKDIYDYNCFLGVFDNIRGVDHTRKCITADIAFEGSNKFVVGYWEGFELMDLAILEKSNGPQIIAGISDVAQHYGVNNADIVFDADGVGAFISGSEGGFIPGAVAFHGGGAVVEVMNDTTGQMEKENYFNLRTQCYYRSGLAVARGERKINRTVGDKMYDDKQTVRQRFMFERKAIKKDSKTPDGKLKIISKDEMKAKLNGDSPDLMDMFMMRELLELSPQYTWVGF
jgi:hypothetical protein